GLFVTMGLTVIAILCTYSRGGFLALSITLLAFWMKAKKQFVTGLVGVCLLGTALAFLPPHWYERMDTINAYQQDQSANDRLIAWLYAIRLAADHPFMGGGFNVVDDSDLYFRYVPESNGVHNFHSIYFQVLGENGYPGLVLFVGLIMASLLTARWITRK